MISDRQKIFLIILSLTLNHHFAAKLFPPFFSCLLLLGASQICDMCFESSSFIKQFITESVRLESSHHVRSTSGHKTEQKRLLLYFRHSLQHCNTAKMCHNHMVIHRALFYSKLIDQIVDFFFSVDRTATLSCFYHVW